jgi:hypothetical protein
LFGLNSPGSAIGSVLKDATTNRGRKLELALIPVDQDLFFPDFDQVPYHPLRNAVSIMSSGNRDLDHVPYQTSACPPPRGIYQLLPISNHRLIDQFTRGRVAQELEESSSDEELPGLANRQQSPTPAAQTQPTIDLTGGPSEQTDAPYYDYYDAGCMGLQAFLQAKNYAVYGQKEEIVTTQAEESGALVDFIFANPGRALTMELSIKHGDRYFSVLMYLAPVLMLRV